MTKKDSNDSWDRLHGLLDSGKGLAELDLSEEEENPKEALTVDEMPGYRTETLATKEDYKYPPITFQKDNTLVGKNGWFSHSIDDMPNLEVSTDGIHQPVVKVTPDKDMTVHGNLEVEGDLVVDGALVVSGNIQAKHLVTEEQDVDLDEDEVFLTKQEIHAIDIALAGFIDFQELAHELGIPGEIEEAVQVLNSIQKKLID